ncbi:hypothetical protein O3P69_008830 [Scylla paramamosain]|uniref:Peptidase A2 domain-containing protein n=1 Tax=Scylla paramamosain TaxID=85552 RepID=A0AAW0TPY6_SCYPA
MATTNDMRDVPACTYDVATWFLHLEAVWDGVDGLTNQFRYQAVVSGLPSEVAARLAGVLAEPPADNRYAAVKSALMAAFGRTPEAYFSALDTAHFEGGRPSAFLACMSDLNRAAGHPLSDAMLCYRHSTFMLHPVRMQLAATRQFLSLAEYSGLVDAVYEAHLASLPSPLSPSACGCGDTRPAQGTAEHSYSLGQRTGRAPHLRRRTTASKTDGGSVPAASGSRPCGRSRSLRILLLRRAFRGGGAKPSAAMCLAPPGKWDTRGPLTVPLPPASLSPAPAGPLSLLSQRAPDSPSLSSPARVRPRHFARTRGSPLPTRPSPPSRAPEQPCSCQRALLWVKDTCSGAQFLVDSGAEVSVVPATEEDRQSQPRTEYDLLTANHTPIATYGTRILRL